MGNRGALYFTNASGGGNLQFGIGGGHASNTQLTITNAASTFAGTIAVQGTGDSYFTGNVGIGTTSPAAALDVVGSGLATLFRVSNTTADATIKYGAITGRHYTNSEENVTGMLITSSSSVTGGTVSIGGGISAANAVNNIILYTAANNTTLIGSERMRITPTGNVGIGVTSPSEKLHVSGSAIVTSNLYSSRSGRGKCSFTLQSNGGSGVPFLLKGTVNAVWGNSESSVTVDFNSRYSAVEEIRVVRNTSANKTFVDVKMSTEDNVEVFVLPFSNANAIAVGFTNVTTLPSGDTVETVLDVHDKAFALRSITGTAEVDQFNITNDIKIGVGTPSPIEKIHLKNNGDVGIALENIADTSGDYWKLWQDNWNGSSNFTFNVNYGGTDHLTVRTDGNVGIGLTNPVDRLDLYDSDDNVGMYFHTATSGTGGGNGLRVGQNNANAFVWNYEATPLSLATGGTARLTINATGGIRFNTGYGAGTLVSIKRGWCRRSLLTAFSWIKFSFDWGFICKQRNLH
jgi:hypothetical protein